VASIRSEGSIDIIDVRNSCLGSPFPDHSLRHFNTSLRHENPFNVEASITDSNVTSDGEVLVEAVSSALISAWMASSSRPSRMSACPRPSSQVHRPGSRGPMRWALANPDETAHLLSAAYPELKASSVLANHKAFMTYVFNETSEKTGLGGFDMDQVQRTFEAVKAAQNITASPALSTFMDTRFLGKP